MSDPIYDNWMSDCEPLCKEPTVSTNKYLLLLPLTLYSSKMEHFGSFYSLVE